MSVKTMTEREKGLVALDTTGEYTGNIAFENMPPRFHNFLWTEFDGTRYYNLDYKPDDVPGGRLRVLDESKRP